MFVLRYIFQWIARGWNIYEIYMVGMEGGSLPQTRFDSQFPLSVCVRLS